MLTCENLSLSLGNKTLFNLSFTLFRNSITLIKGRNGSGKTSLLKILAGIKSPDSGRVLFHQEELSNVEELYAIYLGHDLALKPELTVIEHLSFWSRLFASEQMMQAAIHYLNLFEILGTKIYKLSAGNKKKIAIARLLACNADIWLLDEVTTNLDEENQQIVVDIVETKVQNGGIVIMSSHKKLPFKIYNEIELGS